MISMILVVVWLLLRLLLPVMQLQLLVRGALSVQMPRSRSQKRSQQSRRSASVQHGALALLLLLHPRHPRWLHRRRTGKPS